MAGYEKDQAFAAYLPAIDFAGGYMYNQKGVSVFGSDQLLPVKTFNIEKQDYEFGLVKNGDRRTCAGQWQAYPGTDGLSPQRGFKL